MTTGIYSIVIQDKKQGRTDELFYQNFAAAAKHLEKLHKWASDNGYAPGRDYALTLSEV